MLIAQVSDIHLGFGLPQAPTDGNVPNLNRFRRVMAAVTSLRQKPDLILFTGDLVEGGSNWAYPILKDEISSIDIPIYNVLGNHDCRDSYKAVFGGTDFINGKLAYTIEDLPVRIVILDTLQIGRHHGEFNKSDSEWLEKTLSGAPSKPTILVLHHPPIETGIGWMTPKDNDPWIVRLKAVIERHKQVVHILAGHIHCHISGTFAGRPITVSRSVAPSVALEFEEIDPSIPDGRTMIVDDAPGYTLHQWTGKELRSYSQTATSGDILVKYDANHAFIPSVTLDLLD
ncbi:3',5'-cyclic adenosine monophosphate phosphodiesterase CpdA [Algimonas arctica]|uniref:3',5'-cyclic adenosine monophosphate phosphodiesterase CpdA n=1 Tax=Algimonas arctica TaxID=1479486 RepID=A0A8J3G3I5_9PROT|nr:metallophosphoesterase [Algimonas arctica]GHB04617.1 3',5'-cyclic adenosine monophosphate phosphodiesterase CpdA [Algimonas arctica]